MLRITRKVFWEQRSNAGKLAENEAFEHGQSTAKGTEVKKVNSPLGGTFRNGNSARQQKRTGLRLSFEIAGSGSRGRSPRRD
jgi:hypothetical protein